MTFYFTKAGQVIPSITGSLSALSSCTIMYIIVRTNSKLKTTYHRIMFFMSFWDAIASTAIALTTLPMPSDIIYPFEGGRYGNVTSCEIQGYLYVTGTLFAFSSSVSLTIYYLCTIRYEMQEQTARRRLEPILLVYALIQSVPMPIIMFRQDTLNPKPQESYCSFGKYPDDCSGEDCIRGDASLYNIVRTFFIIGLAGGLLIVLVSMILVVLGVYSKEQNKQHSSTSPTLDAQNSFHGSRKVDIEESDQVSEICNRACKYAEEKNKKLSSTTITSQTETHGQEAKYAGIHDDQSTTNNLNSLKRKGQKPCCSLGALDETTRHVLNQALLYIGAFWLTWLFSLISYFTMGDTLIIQILKCIFQPLQGFFNSLIFIYHKVYLIKAADEDITLMDAIKTVLFSTGKVPEMIISDINIVEENEDIGGQLTNELIMPMPRDVLAEMDLPDHGSSVLDDDLSMSLETPNALSSTGISYCVSSSGMNHGR